MDKACGVDDSSRGAQGTALGIFNMLMNCIASTAKYTMEGIHSRRRKEVLVRDLHNLGRKITQELTP